MTAFNLHPQLAEDTVWVGDLALSQILISRDANYPWLILVPRRPDLVDLTDLKAADQVQLMGEIDVAARALRTVTDCDRLNIAIIGNIVPQLHVHLVARRVNDLVWPRPVWGALPPRDYNPIELDQFVTAARRELGLL